MIKFKLLKDKYMKYIYDNNIIILSQEFNKVYKIEIIYFYNKKKKEPCYFSKYYVIS